MKRIINFLLIEIKLFNIYFALKKKVLPFSTHKRKPLILFEFSNYAASQIGGYYFISELLKKEKLEVKGFYNGYGVKTPFKKSFLESFKWKIKQFFLLGFFKIYRIYGLKDIFIPSVDYVDSDLTNKIYQKIKKKINSKKDVLKISVKNTLIGDLIYDTYLNRYLQPTVDINNKEFQLVMKECIELALYWHDFFIRNKVKYIIGTHGVYSYAIPYRIALNFKVRGFLTNLHGIKEVTNDFIYEHSPDRNKKNLLNTITLSKKKKYIKKAKSDLKKLTNGYKIKNRDYTLKKSSFIKYKSKKVRLIKPSNKIKILVSPHDFFDAAHGFGDHKLFEDYYEWLKFTLDLSLKTDYEWYVKTHPDLMGKFGEKQRATREIVSEMVSNYKNVKMLPPNYSHRDIINGGIDFVITCHGSVAYEYAMENIPTIIGSKCNPYKEFKFSIQPKDRKDYKRKIMNLVKIKKLFKINKRNIYEFYALKFYVVYTLNWVFNYRDYCNFIGSWYNWQNTNIFKYWILKKNKRLDSKIYAIINNFLDSNSNMLFSFHEAKNN